MNQIETRKQTTGGFKLDYWNLILFSPARVAAVFSIMVSRLGICPPGSLTKIQLKHHIIANGEYSNILSRAYTTTCVTFQNKTATNNTLYLVMNIFDAPGIQAFTSFPWYYVIPQRRKWWRFGVTRVCSYPVISLFRVSQRFSRHAWAYLEPAGLARTARNNNLLHIVLRKRQGSVDAFDAV